MWTRFGVVISHDTGRPLQIFTSSPTTFFWCLHCHTVILNDKGAWKIKPIHITDCLSKMTSILSTITKETPDLLIRPLTLQCPCDTHCNSNRSTNNSRNIEVTFTIKHEHATAIQNLILYFFGRETMQECMIHVSMSRENIIPLIDIGENIDQLLLITTCKMQCKR